MLALHLNPDVDAASRKHETINADIDFIVRQTGMDQNASVIDLGCGPGLYVDGFAKKAAFVKGIDFSQRSIEYAKNHIQSKHRNTEFIEMNYLSLDYEMRFNIATMINYDFCALNPNEQQILLSHVFKALKKGGCFIFDIYTENKQVSTSIDISVKNDGFWSDGEYIEILQRNIYTNPFTEGLQYTIFQESGDIKNIRIYHRLFSTDEIRQMLLAQGFIVEHIYENLRGDVYNKGSETYAIFARKNA